MIENLLLAASFTLPNGFTYQLEYHDVYDRYYIIDSTLEIINLELYMLNNAQINSLGSVRELEAFTRLLNTQLSLIEIACENLNKVEEVLVVYQPELYQEYLEAGIVNLAVCK